MAGKRVHFVMPEELVERIDAALPEGVSRGEFVRRAVEQALSEAKEPAPAEQADPGSVPSSEGVRSASPAEPPKHSALAREIERNNEQIRSVSRRSSHSPNCKCPVCL